MRCSSGTIFSFSHALSSTALDSAATLALADIMTALLLKVKQMAEAEEVI
jgi:hypothetical protein